MELQKKDEQRLQAVTNYLNNVLEYGRDQYRESPSPLFADGLNIETKEHVRWKVNKDKEIVMSNLANQQNLFRALTGLSHLTGNEKYKKAAQRAIEYHFDFLVDDSGLMQWGGHRLIDLLTLQIAGPENKGLVHEFKNHFPYYDLMFEVSTEDTKKFIEAFWNAHIFDWGNLEMSRHGRYGLPLGKLWDQPFNNPPSFRQTKGLSFINAGNDLIYSAGVLYNFTKDEKPWIWGKRLAKMYVDARHPETRLGTYQYTQNKKEKEEPKDTTDPTFTHSLYGDRAQRQFGPEFGEIALEGNILTERHAEVIYVRNALMEMQLFEEIGEQAQELLDWTIEGLKAFYKYGYIQESNYFRPMFTDGTDLSNYVIPRDGYYGKKGTVINQFWAGFHHLYTYARAFSLTGDFEFWKIMRSIGIANDLGDIGKEPGEAVKLKETIKTSNPYGLLALLEIYKRVQHEDYLKIARVIGNNIVKEKYYDGWFVETKQDKYVNFDRAEPLALLLLEEAIQGKKKQVPYFMPSETRLHGGYYFGEDQYKDIKSTEIFLEKR